MCDRPKVLRENTALSFPLVEVTWSIALSVALKTKMMLKSALNARLLLR
jgi:hypothetical protein